MHVLLLKGSCDTCAPWKVANRTVNLVQQAPTVVSKCTEHQIESTLHIKRKFVPCRERSMLPLGRLLGECWLGKRPVVLRIRRSEPTHYAEQMQILLLNVAVRIVTSRLKRFDLKNCVKNHTQLAWPWRRFNAKFRLGYSILLPITHDFLTWFHFIFATCFSCNCDEGGLNIILFKMSICCYQLQTFLGTKFGSIAGLYDTRKV